MDEVAGYIPELGQACFGNPTGEFEMPPFVDALWDAILDEMERVHCNRTQDDAWNDWDIPDIPGLIYRPYWWGEADAPEAGLPNFEAGGVALRFYKHPRRGVSVDRVLTRDEWIAWYEQVMAIIQAADVR